MGKLQASQILKSKRIWVERMRAPLEKQKPLRGASVQIRHASIQPAPCIAKATAKGGPYFLQCSMPGCQGPNQGKNGPIRKTNKMNTECSKGSINRLGEDWVLREQHLSKANVRLQCHSAAGCRVQEEIRSARVLVVSALFFCLSALHTVFLPGFFCCACIWHGRILLLSQLTHPCLLRFSSFHRGTFSGPVAVRIKALSNYLKSIG